MMEENAQMSLLPDAAVAAQKKKSTSVNMRSSARSSSLTSKNQH